MNNNCNKQISLSSLRQHSSLRMNDSFRSASSSSSRQRQRSTMKRTGNNTNNHDIESHHVRHFLSHAAKRWFRTLFRIVLIPSLFLDSSDNYYTFSHANVAPARVIPRRIQQCDGVQTLNRGHSHNDYVQQHPLSSALDHQITSIEVDVFPRNNELWVAHTIFELDESRTIDSLYIQPLLKHLQQQQEDSNFIMTNNEPLHLSDKRIKPFPQVLPRMNCESNFIVDLKGKTINLLVDFKGDSAASVKLLKNFLEPLRPYLSRTDVNGIYHHGKVTVLLSGNRPTDESLYDEYSGERFLFLDGREGDIQNNTDTTLVPMVSISWASLMVPYILGYWEDVVRSQVILAHSQGKRLRIWGAPNQESLWRSMVKSNVDLLSIDDHSRYVTFSSIPTSTYM